MKKLAYIGALCMVNAFATWISDTELSMVTGAPMHEVRRANNWFNNERFIEDAFKPYYHVIPNLIIKHGYKTGIEIGVAFGGHSEAILQRTGVEKLWSIDPYIPNAQMGPYPSDLYYETYYHNVRSRLKVFGQRSELIRDFSENIIDQFADASLDFAFIDADHRYEPVKRDIEMWWPKIKSAGMLSGDDYATSYPGVPQAVNEFFNALGLEVHTDKNQPRIWWVIKP